MLCISRRTGESILIGESMESIADGKFIEVTVIEVDRGRMRLGIEATGDVRVYREELLLRHCQSNGLDMPTEPSVPLFASEPPAAEVA